LNHGFVRGADPKESILRFNALSVKDSRDFFAHSRIENFTAEGDRICFSSTIRTPYAVNNTVYCRLFPAARPQGRAVVVLPQWNANESGHVSLCRLLSRLGITAVRLTLPYHEQRNPSGPRSDFLVSPNIGRTIQAIQQAVVDSRNTADWLHQQGYHRLGIVGTSVGSCIGFLAFVHDSRFQVGVFNHVSSFFGDVVWNGISTRHVRNGIERTLSREELHHAWAVISPNSYVSRLRESPSRKRLYISARYDLTFPPDLAQLLFSEHERCRVPYEVSFLPCGHYTSAITPFKHLDGFLIANYFRRHL
jgi:hypothetical protein